jgi:hypothetical protein
VTPTPAPALSSAQRSSFSATHSSTSPMTSSSEFKHASLDDEGQAWIHLKQASPVVFCQSTSANRDRCTRALEPIKVGQVLYSEKPWLISETQDRMVLPGMSISWSLTASFLTQARSDKPKMTFKRFKANYKTSDAGEQQWDAADDGMVQLLMEANPSVPGDEIKDVYCRLVTNSLSVCETASGVDKKRAVAMFGWLTLINHSCRANATTKYSAADNRLTLVANRDIAAGDEITITYMAIQALSGDRKTLIDFPDLDVQTRQKVLRREYGFVCQCQLCMEQSSTPKSAPQPEESAMPEVPVSLSLGQPPQTPACKAVKSKPPLTAPRPVQQS